MQANFNLAVTSPQLPGRSYKSICGWPLPMPDMEVYEGGLAVNQGRLAATSICPGAA